MGGKNPVSHNVWSEVVLVSRNLSLTDFISCSSILVMKKCIRCLSEKPLNEFYKNIGNKDGLQGECIVCTKARVMVPVLKNGKSRKEATRENRKRYIRFNKFKIIEYLSSSGGCIVCGEKDPVVLEFDHLSDKKIEVTKLVHKGCSWYSILQEIKKCQILCANCHRKKTSKDFNWYKNPLNIDKFSSFTEQPPNSWSEAVPYNKSLKGRADKSTINRRKVIWPDKELLEILVKIKPIKIIAADNGVCSRTVLRWIKHYKITDLPEPRFWHRKENRKKYDLVGLGKPPGGVKP